jgi:cobalt-zinc-cadmium efflux system membrane fusion protein
MHFGSLQVWRPLCLVLACAAAGCGSSAASTQPEGTAAVVPQKDGTVEVANRSLAYLAIEAIKPDKTVPAVRAPAHVAFRDGAVAEVAAPIEGRVVEISVKVGDHVKAGDALVTIQSPAAASARAELDSAVAARKSADAALERQTSMLAKGVGIESEKFQAEIEATKAAAELARAQRSVAYLGAGSGSTVVVHAPISGTVLQRKSTLGAAADPNGEALIEIGDPNALWIVADVFEHDLPLVKAGAEVSVELATQTEPVRGRVAAVGSTMSDGMRTAPIYISLEDANVALRAGMFARAAIASDAVGALGVPVTAVLIKDGRRSVVYVQKNEHTFAEREVSIGQPVDGRVQVLSGLGAGDRVVTRGALLLDEAAEQLL